MRRLAALVFFSLFCCVRRSEPAPAPPPAPAVSEPSVTAQRPVDAGPSPEPFRLLVGGDVTLGYHYEEYVDDQRKQGRSLDDMLEYGFANVRQATLAADLFVVNLECPFTSRGEKIPKNFNFRARPELVGALHAGGVDAVSLANNHLMDYGLVGLLDTMEALDAAKIPHFGAGRNLAEARAPLILTVKGTRVALLGYFFLGTRNIEPAEVIATDTTPGVAGHSSDVAIMERMVRDDVALARHLADVVIPFFHWGREGTYAPEPYQLQLARAAIEAGAATVLGSHPHVLQGMELHRGVPVAYSLGNFVFGGNWNPRDKESVLFGARFSPGGFLSAELLPIRIDRYPERPMQPYLVQGAERDSVLDHLAQYSKDFPATLPELSGRTVRDGGAGPSSVR